MMRDSLLLMLTNNIKLPNLSLSGGEGDDINKAIRTTTVIAGRKLSSPN